MARPFALQFDRLESRDCPTATPYQDADALYSAMYGGFGVGTDEEAIYAVLSVCSEGF